MINHQLQWPISWWVFNRFKKTHRFWKDHSMYDPTNSVVFDIRRCVRFKITSTSTNYLTIFCPIFGKKNAMCWNSLDFVPPYWKQIIHNISKKATVLDSLRRDLSKTVACFEKYRNVFAVWVHNVNPFCGTKTSSRYLTSMDNKF